MEREARKVRDILRPDGEVVRSLLKLINQGVPPPQSICRFRSDKHHNSLKEKDNSSLFRADWWYWTKKISHYQSIAKKVNGDTTKRIRKYYRKRKLRFRHVINTIVFRFVKLCYEKGVTEIVVGDVKGIRQNNKNAKANAMIHNFWSFKYIINRLITTAENFGIKVKLVKESYVVSLSKMWFD